MGKEREQQEVLLAVGGMARSAAVVAVGTGAG